MENLYSILSRSILEFQGAVPEEIKSIAISLDSINTLHYFFQVERETEEVEDYIQECLHEILTGLGVKKENDMVVGYNYQVDYSVMSIASEWHRIIERPTVYMLYVNSNESYEQTTESAKFPESTVDEAYVRSLANDYLLGTLLPNDFVQVKQDDTGQINLKLPVSVNGKKEGLLNYLAKKNIAGKIQLI